MVIALFVLLIAAMNYMNLATAQSLKRAKETGLRKVLGAGRATLFSQFMAEAVLLTFISAAVAVLLVILILPAFNMAIGKSFTVQDVLNGNAIFSLLSISVGIGFLAGSYPALVMSRFKPIRALSANSSTTKNVGAAQLRKVLVTVQFALSVLLIIAAITIKDQLLFIQNKDIGMDKDHVMVIPLPNRGGMENIGAVKNELLQINAVKSTATSSTVPGKRVHIMSVRVPNLLGADPGEEGDDVTGMRIMSGDAGMVSTFGLEILEGRDFMERSIADSAGGFILNEAAIQEFGIEDPIGKPFEYVYGLPEPKKGAIIGVVKDFNYASLHGAVEPLMMHIFPRHTSYMSVKIDGGSVARTVEEVKSTWQKTQPAVPFDFFFMDEAFDDLYRAEGSMSKIITWFTGFAILTVCLGLFGLISFIATQRTREIGIRKVLGATVGNVTTLLAKEFMVLVVLGNVLAWLPAWYFLNECWPVLPTAPHWNGRCL